MARVNSTGKESSSNFSPSNGTGLAVRTALKDILESLRTFNSAAGDPSGTANVAAYQPHINSSNNLLKIRNAANSAYVTLGDVSQTNFGLLSKSGGTMTGVLKLQNGNTPAAPKLSFNGDTDLGLYRKQANVMGFSSSGTEQMIFSTSGITLRLRNEMRFGDNNSSHYVGLRAAATISTSFTLTLPTADGSNGQFLKTNGSGTLSFATPTADLSSLNASNLTSGTIPDARFPSTLPAVSGANLTNLSGASVKAFVNFKGTGSVSIRNQTNVSSITDNGTGDYTVNFSNNLTDSNYTPLLATLGHDTAGAQIQTVIRGNSTTGPTLMSASACRIHRGNTSTNNYVDGHSIYFAALR